MAWSQEPTVTCVAVETSLNCTGTGILNQSDVRSAGVYSKFVTAVIESGITFIGQKSFAACSLPDTVIGAGSNAFDGCALVSLDLPKDFTDLKTTFVNNCPYFERFTVGGSMDGVLPNHIVEDGFLLSKDGKTLVMSPSGRCSGGDLTLPSGIEVIGDACRWARASKIIIPDSVTNVKSNAFYCSLMTSLKLGKKVQTFSVSALSSCTYLESVDVGENKDFYMLNNLFCKGIVNEDGTKVSTIYTLLKVFKGRKTIINSLQLCPTLLEFRFAKPKSGQTATLESLLNNQVIGELYEKNGKSQWRIVSCVGGATSIDLSSLTNYTWIATNAFRDCQKLESITLHSGVTQIGDYIARGCTNLVNFSYAGCYSGDSTEIGKEGSNAISGITFGNTALTSIVWPRGEFTVGQQTFNACGFENVTFPAGLKSIGNECFNRCYNLKSIIINDKLTTIGSGAFRNCPLLESVTFNSLKDSNLVSVDSMAFANCSSLKSITFPDTPTNIVPGCFAYSLGLTSILFHENTGAYRSDGVACYTEENGNPYHTLVACPAGLENFTFAYSRYASHLPTADMRHILPKMPILNGMTLPFVLLTL